MDIDKNYLTGHIKGTVYFSIKACKQIWLNILKLVPGFLISVILIRNTPYKSRNSTIDNR